MSTVVIECLVIGTENVLSTQRSEGASLPPSPSLRRDECDARKQPAACRGIELAMALPANVRKSWFWVPVARTQLYMITTRIDYIWEIARSGQTSRRLSVSRCEGQFCVKRGAEQTVGLDSSVHAGSFPGVALVPPKAWRRRKRRALRRQGLLSIVG